MQVIAWDTETHLIKRGCLTPKLVCVSACDGDSAGVFLSGEGLSQLRGWLEDTATIMVGHNIFYDLGVACVEDPSLLPLVFEAIEQNRVHDTQVRQMVMDNDQGKLKFEWDAEANKWRKPNYSLQSLTYKYTKRRPAKGEGSWQLRFNELDGVPVSEWPDGPEHYATGDAINTWDVWRAQESILEPEGLPQNWRHIAHAWALHLASCRGFRTDKERTLKLEAELLEEMQGHAEIAQAYGFIRDSGTKNEKKAREAVERLLDNPTKTRTGKTQLTREQLRAIPCPFCKKDFDEHTDDCEEMGLHVGLWALSEVKRVEKKLSTYIKILKQGFEVPVQPRYNVIIETFRTSSSGPNIQNYPRKGGIRDCIIPRDGWLFAFCDFDTVEMATLGQVCIDWFGYSKIAEAINSGLDLHVSFAAKLLQISYDECMERFKAGDPEVAGSDGARQFAKIANYGFAGGMGVDAFIDYAKTAYGMIVPRLLAERLHREFRQHWELDAYFNQCASFIGPEGHCPTQIYPRSGLRRGRVKYTAVCNGNFQHLAAMLAKDALYYVTKECYAVPESPLYGCRPWLFCHDEIGLEIPEAWIGTAAASAAARRMQDIMIACARHWCPDLDIGATVAMARNWLKGAEPMEDEHGNLVPVKKDGKEWVHDSVH